MAGDVEAPSPPVKKRKCVYRSEWEHVYAWVKLIDGDSNLLCFRLVHSVVCVLYKKQIPVSDVYANITCVCKYHMCM